MPVPLNEMMKAVPPEKREVIERNASAMAADYRLRGGEGTADRTRPTPVVLGTKAMTGQRCPESGVWRVESIPSATLPIAIHNLMPPYHDRAVTWELVQHAAA